MFENPPFMKIMKLKSFSFKEQIETQLFFKKSDYGIMEYGNIGITGDSIAPLLFLPFILDHFSHLKLKTMINNTISM